VIVALKIAHIAVAAAWFGHKLLIPSDIRESIRASAGELSVQRLKRAERLGVVSGLLTLLSGLALIYLTTGFGDAPLRIYVGLGAVLAMFVVGAVSGRPASKQIKAGLLEGDAVMASAAEPRLRRALGLENLLWVLALGTMVIA
jgi:hypothetical protein